MIDRLAEQMIPCVTSENTMISIGINQLSEILISLNQRFHIFCRILIMHIVIGQSVTEQKGTNAYSAPYRRYRRIASS